MALKSKLGDFARGIAQAIDNGVGETAEQVADTAQQLVPVDTGALRTSIEVFGAAGTGERTVEAGQSLDYAPFVEYGTSKASAQPFMTPAAERNRKNLDKNVAKHLRDLERQSKV